MNDRARRAALKKLPPTLNATYQRILGNVEESHNYEIKRLVRHTLQIIAYSPCLSIPPLNIEGLCEAVSIPEGSDTFQNDDVVDENEILQWCSSLVRRSPDGQYLEFAHYSVEEFLRDVCPGDAVFDSYSVSTEKARSLVGQLSLRYLTFRNHELDFGPTETEMHATLAKNAMRPFYEFATLCWVDCIREQPAREFVLESIQSLFNQKKSASFHAWALELLRPCFMKIHKDYWDDLLRAGSGLLRPDFTTLHMASGLGLLSICEELVREGASMINRDSAYGTPLHCAIGGLDICADGIGRVLNAVSHIVHAPESSRAAHDRQNIVRTLLGSGAQVTVRLATRHRVLSPLSLSAILASSEMGSRRGFLPQQLRMITELLSTGFQVEEQDLVHFSNLFIRPNVATDDSESIYALQKLSDTLTHSHQNASTSQLQHLLQTFKADYGIPLRTGPTQSDCGKYDMDGFIAAIRNNDSVKLERLLEGEGAAMLKNFRLTAPGTDAEKWTPVHVAINSRAINTLDVLLKYGFDSDELDSTSKGDTPLHLCCRLNFESGARALLHDGASCLKRNKWRENAWYIAASSDATMVLQVLLALAADSRTEALQMESCSGDTPIWNALMELKKESVLLLLPYCSSKQFWKGERNICFRQAAIMGSTKVTKGLLDAGLELDDWDSELGSPLHHLRLDCTAQHVRLLKATFPHSPRRSMDGKSAFELHLTLSLEFNREADEEVLTEFLPEDASELNHLSRVRGLQLLEGDLVALMHHAACLGRTTIVRFLHRNGAEINVRTRNGYTPLHLAVQAEDLDMVDTLLELGADQTPVFRGLTPLALACKIANSAIVWTLLHEQTVPATTSVNHDGGTLSVGITHPRVLDALGTELLDAIVRQDIEACVYLRRIGFPMNEQLAKSSGLTPLMAAIRLPDCLDVAEWLLDNSASVSVVAPPWPSRSNKSTSFYTALEAAASRPSCNPILSKMTWKYFDEGGCFLGLSQSPIHAAVGNPEGLSIMLYALQEILSDRLMITIMTDCNPNIENRNRGHVL